MDVDLFVRIAIVRFLPWLLIQIERQCGMQNNKSPGQGEKIAHSVAETANILGISTRSVHRLIERGFLRRSKALRKILIPRMEIEKFLRDTTEVV